LGVIHKVGLEIGGKVIQMRKYGHTVVEMIGGRKVHPCTSIPGGLTKGITEEQRKEIEEMGRWAIEFAQFSLKAFNDIVLSNKTYLDLIVGDVYTIEPTTWAWLTAITRSISTTARCAL